MKRYAVIVTEKIGRRYIVDAESVTDAKNQVEDEIVNAEEYDLPSVFQYPNNLDHESLGDNDRSDWNVFEIR